MESQPIDHRADRVERLKRTERDSSANASRGDTFAAANDQRDGESPNGCSGVEHSGY